MMWQEITTGERNDSSSDQDWTVVKTSWQLVAPQQDPYQCKQNLTNMKQKKGRTNTTQYANYAKLQQRINIGDTTQCINQRPNKSHLCFFFGLVESPFGCSRLRNLRQEVRLVKCDWNSLENMWNQKGNPSVTWGFSRNMAILCVQSTKRY